MIRTIHDASLLCLFNFVLRTIVNIKLKVEQTISMKSYVSKIVFVNKKIIYNFIKLFVTKKVLNKDLVPNLCRNFLLSSSKGSLFYILVPLVNTGIF